MAVIPTAPQRAVLTANSHQQNNKKLINSTIIYTKKKDYEEVFLSRTGGHNDGGVHQRCGLLFQ